MNQVTEMELTGLIGSSPIGTLAAFGLLRVCAEIEALRDAKLGWVHRDDWFAVITISEGINRVTLVELLGDHFKNQSTDVYSWSEDIRVTPDDYKSRLEKSVEYASQGNRRMSDYLTAFASEIAVDNSKGLVKPTWFYMTSGQQKFLSSALKLVERYRSDQTDKLEEALFGPWLYRDEQHSLGWDPSTERMYALRHKKPGEEDPASVSAAIRLALEALPLFPVFPDQQGRLNTTGFIRIDRENIFRWPVWQTPIGLNALKTLLMSDLGNSRSLTLQGVNAVYRSTRFEFGQGYGIFRPAQLVWQRH